MGLWVFLIAFGILILFFALYCYKIAFYSPKERKQDLYDYPDGEQYEYYGPKMVEISRIMEDASCSLVEITGHRGTKLTARLYEYFPGSPVLILFHGYRSMALRDCAGGFALAQKLGFNVLVPDQRAHGASEGRSITFGIHERYDCQKWAEFAAKRYGSNIPLVLSGISMGAATVLMASDLNLPENVVAIMADCPYASPAGIIGKVAGDMGFPEKLSLPIIYLAGAVFGRFQLFASSAEKALRKTHLPILLIHGEDDRFVPCDMSRQLHAAAPEKTQLHTFPDAGHGLCYLCDPRRYERICVNFLWQQDALRPYLEKNPFARSIQME